MALINNQAVLQKLVDELRLYPAKDKVPSELADKILPVFQINSELIEVSPAYANIIRTERRLVAGSTTLYTTSATGDFFLTNIILQVFNDAPSAAHAGSGKITINVDGVAQSIAFIEVDTDPQAGWAPIVTLNLQNPILIDKATNIVLTSVGAGIIANGTIVGYTKD